MTVRKIISKKSLGEITDGFESALDYVKSLDPLPFYVKREMAEKAMKAALDRALEYLSERGKK